MKRPFAVFGITMFFTLSVLCAFDSAAVCGFFAAASAVLFALCVLNKKSRRAMLLPTVFAAAAFACLVLLSAQSFWYYPALSLASDNARMKMKICDYPECTESRVYFRAVLLSAENTVKPKVRLSLSAQEENAFSLSPGDEIAFSGKLYVIAGESRQAHLSYKSRGIFLGAYPYGKITVTKRGGFSVMKLIKNEKRKTENQIASAFSENEAGLITAVLTGDKSRIDSRLYALFRNSGTAHILAVSGLHLSVWIISLLRMLSLAGFDRKKAAWFLSAFDFLVMAFASFSGSVLRAGLMMLLVLLGIILGKSADSLNSLGFAATVILLHNPFSCFDPSFLLSFISTLSILAFAVPASQLLLKKRPSPETGGAKEKLISFAVHSVVISLTVTAATLPASAYYFTQVSLVSVFSNLALVPMVTPLVVFSGFYVMFYFVPVLSSFFRLSAVLLSRYCISCAKFFGGLSFSAHRFESETLVLWIALACVVCAAGLWAVKKGKKSLYFLTAALYAATFVLGFAADSYLRENRAAVTVYNAGEGLVCSVAHRNEAAVVVFDCDGYLADSVFGGIGERYRGAGVLLTGEASAGLISDKSAFGKIYLRGENEGAGLLFENFAEMPDEISVGDVRLKFDGKTVFIRCFGRTAAVTAGENREADVLITNNGSLGLDINKNSVIISSDGVLTADGLQRSDGGEILLGIKKDGDYYVRGENSWRCLMKSN